MPHDIIKVRTMTTITELPSIFDLPREHLPIRGVAEMAHLHRNYFESIGWDKRDCSIGYYDGTTKLADDYGAVIYRLNDRGQITRETVGNPGKLIEFIRWRMESDISRYNRA